MTEHVSTAEKAGFRSHHTRASLSQALGLNFPNLPCVQSRCGCTLSGCPPLGQFSARRRGVKGGCAGRQKGGSGARLEEGLADEGEGGGHVRTREDSPWGSELSILGALKQQTQAVYVHERECVYTSM